MPLFKLSVFAVALCVVFASGTLGQGLSYGAESQEQPPIVGNWEWSVDIGPSRGTVKMEVTLVEDKLRAVLTTPNGDKLNAENFAVRGDRVTFRLRRKRGPVTVTVTHSGVLKENKIEGTFSARGGPVKQDGSWAATRVER